MTRFCFELEIPTYIDKYIGGHQNYMYMVNLYQNKKYYNIGGHNHIYLSQHVLAHI